MIPTYVDQAKFDEFVFPKYGDAKINSGSTDIERATPIVCSFPKNEGYKLTMPKILRKKIVKVLKKYSG